MSIKTFFQKKSKTPKTGYLLDVIETSPTTMVRKSRIKGGFSYGKKLVAGLIVAAIAITGFSTAAVAATSAPEKAAAFDLFNPASWVCDTVDSAGAYLNGSSETLKSGWLGTVKSSPINNGLNITITSGSKTNPYVTGKGTPKKGVRWTALEQYGYYAPSFEAWRGILHENDKFDNDVWPFAGSGGYGSTQKYGDIVGISEANRSLMYEEGMMGCLNFDGNFNAGFGNLIFGMTKIAVALSSETYGIAFNMDSTNESSPLHGMAKGVETMITGGDNPDRGLRSILYLDWLILLIFIATFSLIWVGLVKRRSMEAGQAAVWMIAASAAGMIFLTNPLAVPAFIDKMVGEVSASITKVILPAENSNTNLCKVDGSGGDASIRQVKCAVWYSTIYSPWVKGQFGVDEYDLSRYAGNKSRLTGDALQRVNSVAWMYEDGYKSKREGASAGASQAVPWSGDVNEGKGFKPVSEQKSANINGSRGIFSKADIKLGAQPYTGSMNWAIYMLDRQNAWGPSNAEQGVDYSEIAFNQLVVNKNDQWKEASDAMGSAFMSIMGAGGPVIVMFMLSITMIGYQLSMLFLIAFSPLVFLVAVAPGWGRSIAMRWLELIVGLLIKRIILVFFLVLFIKLYMMVIQSDIDWWIQALLALVLSFTAITQRDKITNLFSEAINFGGRKDIDGGGAVAQQGKQVASRASRMAFSAAGAGAGYAWANSRAKRDAKKRQAEAYTADRSNKKGPKPDQKQGPRGGTGNPTDGGGPDKTGGTGSGRRSPDTQNPNGGSGTTTPPPVSRKQAREDRAKETATRNIFARRRFERQTKAQDARTVKFKQELDDIKNSRNRLKNERAEIEARRSRGAISKREMVKAKRRVLKAREELRKEENVIRKKYSKDTAKFNRYIERESSSNETPTERRARRTKQKFERELKKGQKQYGSPNPSSSKKPTAKPAVKPVIKPTRGNPNPRRKP